jgi:hypothetical protein
VKANTGARGDVLDSGTLWELEIDPVNSDVLYAGALYGSDASLQKSINGGVDWKSMWPKGSNVQTTVEYNFMQSVAIDPTNHEHLAVTFHANCVTGPTGNGCMADSTDAGETWNIFKNPTGGWAEGAGVIILGATTFLFQTVQDGVFLTTNKGMSWSKVAGGGFPEVYHAKDGKIYMAATWGVIRSADGSVWDQPKGSPQSVAVIGDGDRMFASWNVSNKAAYWAATESDGTNWASIPSPPVSTRGENFAMDRDHHVLYAAHRADGIWRMVTK